MITLHHPFTEAAVRALRAGEAVRVSGRVCTGRDRLHKHLAEGGACPADLRDGALFHCGPVVVPRSPDPAQPPDGRGDWHLVAAGPTTSVR